MKKILTFVIMCLMLFSKSYSQTHLKSPTETDQNNTFFQNEKYRFKVPIPNTWYIYAQIKDDTRNKRTIVSWGLPKLYSELEKTEIENAISITAYLRSDVTSLLSLMQLEYLRLDPTETALEIDKSDPNARMIYTTTPSGLSYKGKSYFVFKNGIGYIITFMATPGTYDKNIQVFEKFYKTIIYL